MQVDPRHASLGALLNRRISDPTVIAAGFRAPFANFEQLLGTQATLGQALRIFPQYTGVTTGGMMNHSGNSTYHAAIIKVTKRFSGGLTLLGSYTWSKLLTDADSSEPWIAGVVGAGVGAGSAQNHYNRAPEKSYGVLDRRQRVRSGQGQLLQPVFFTGRTNPFADPFGNAPRLLGATRMFPTIRTNIAVARKIRFKERVSADLRLDVFDLWNQKTWNRPSSQDLSSNQFGVITGASGNRNMQIGLKLQF